MNESRFGEQVFGNRSKNIVEIKDIQPITEEERNKKASSQFYLWFASNLTIGDLALGSLIYAITAIPVFWLLVAVAAGNLLGGGLLAMMSIMGPKTGLPQMMIGRRSFGDSGGRVMAGLQWMNSLGWFTFNSIIAASAVAILIFGLNKTGAVAIGGFSLGIQSYILPIVIVCVIVAILAYVGERIIHAFEKLMSLVLGIMFLVILYYIVQNFGFPAVTFQGSFPSVSFGLTLALTFSYIMSWGPYAADYSRYIDSNARSRSVFLYTLLGGAGASAFVEIIGYLVAMNTGAAPEISTQLFNLTSPLSLGAFSMIALFLGGLSANALNLYSNSLSMKSIGINLSRRLIVVVIVIISMIVSYFGYVNYYSYFEDFLLILDYWITPWLGVMIADFFIVSRKSSYEPKGKSRGAIAILSYLVSIAVSVPFMNPGYWYSGPLSPYLGGVDISFFISFILAVIIYTVISRAVQSAGKPQRK